MVEAAINLLVFPASIFIVLTAILIVPGLTWTLALGKGQYLSGGGLIIKSFCASLILLECIVLFFSVFSVGYIERTSFILAIIGVIIAGYLLGMQRGIYKRVYAMSPQLILKGITIHAPFIITLIFLLVSMAGKLHIEDLDGDGHEVFWHSFYLLKTLPYQNIFQLPYIVPVVGMSLICFFGKNVLSLRILYFFYATLIYITFLLLIRKRQREALHCSVTFSFCLHIIIFTLFMFFQPYWEPFYSDVTAVTADVIVSVIIMCIVWSLHNKEYDLFVLAAIILLQALRYAPVILWLLIGAYWLCVKEERKPFKTAVIKVAMICSGWAFLILFYSWQFGYSISAVETFSELVSRFYAVPNSVSAIGFLSKYALLIGGLPFLSIFIIRSKKDHTANFVSLSCLFYILLLLMARGRNVHNLTPIAFLPLVGFFRYLDSPTAINKRLRIIHGIIAVICAIFLWPVSYKPHTNYKDFWSQAQFLYPKSTDYINNYVESDLESLLEDKGLSHIFSGTWQLYSLISDDFSHQYKYYFTDKDWVSCFNKDLFLVSCNSRVCFLVHEAKGIQHWQETKSMNAQERYVSFFEFMWNTVRRKGQIEY